MGSVLSLAFISLAFTTGFVSATASQGVQWSPEQWAFLSTSIISSIGASVAAINAARRSGYLHQSLRLPSNHGIAAGELLEAIGQVQHYQGNIIAAALTPQDAEPPVIPSALEIARELSTMTKSNQRKGRAGRDERRGK